MTFALLKVDTPIRARRKRVWSYCNRVWSYCMRHWPTITLVVLVTLFVAAALWPWYCMSVPAGYVAVKWQRFAGGTDTERVYGEGSHFFFPWNKMSLYDARVQQVSRDFDVLTRDGLMMAVNVTLRFHLNEAAVGLIHKHVGSDYVETLLVPAVGSYARLVFSQKSTDDSYTEQRGDLPAIIKQAMLNDLTNNFGLASHRNLPWLFLDDVLIRSMRFPPEVQGAINHKMEEYQLKQEYAYRLEREQLESRRKEIEAQGIARFQGIVSAGISDAYLRWKGVDATLALAQSANAKVVVIGAGKDGMPIILGGLDTPIREGHSPVIGSAGSATSEPDRSIIGRAPTNDERQTYSPDGIPITSRGFGRALTGEPSTSGNR
jgi:regulator of protease activity HflC (stomatin/prohibitin superfamily)